MPGTIRFAVDEDFDERIIRGISSRNDEIDLLNVKSVGLRNAADSEILAWAAEQNRVLLTHDRNTMGGEATRRINDGRPMPGLIIVPQSGRLGAFIEQIIDIFIYDDIENWENRIAYFH